MTDRLLSINFSDGYLHVKLLADMSMKNYRKIFLWKLPTDFFVRAPIDFLVGNYRQIFSVRLFFFTMVVLGDFSMYYATLRTNIINNIHFAFEKK